LRGERAAQQAGEQQNGDGMFHKVITVAGSTLPFARCVDQPATFNLQPATIARRDSARKAARKEPLAGISDRCLCISYMGERPFMRLN
jgi:hypothetical protein